MHQNISTSDFSDDEIGKMRVSHIYVNVVIMYSDHSWSK